ANSTPLAENAAAAERSATARSGRGLAGLALLLALSALSVAGYLYWVTRYEPDPLAARVAALEADVAKRQVPQSDPLMARLAAIEAELRALQTGASADASADPDADTDADTDADPDAGVDADLESGLVSEAGGAAANERTADDAPGRLDAAAGSAVAMTDSGASWRLAEVRYLLRMANHRLGLERDVRGAALLLAAADDALRDLDDPRLTPVRALIAEERLAVAGLPAVDAEGLYLALEAIKRDLDQLPLDLPALADRAVPDAQVEPPAAGWRAIWDAVSELVRVRRVDAARPLLAPEEGAYLELNLRLMLERAQLAGLRREQGVFGASIETAIDWIEAWQDVSDPEVRRVVDGLRGIAAVRLDAPVPDLSGSLVALDAVLAGRTPNDIEPEVGP
ncbi:MAG: uroporphyrinogen-III C-methyltransferase, partial [Gammaproteobacteria bacterium]